MVEELWDSELERRRYGLFLGFTDKGVRVWFWKLFLGFRMMKKAWKEFG